MKMIHTQTLILQVCSNGDTKLGTQISISISFFNLAHIFFLLCPICQLHIPLGFYPLYFANISVCGLQQFRNEQWQEVDRVSSGSAPASSNILQSVLLLPHCPILHPFLNQLFFFLRLYKKSVADSIAFHRLLFQDPKGGWEEIWEGKKRSRREVVSAGIYHVFFLIASPNLVLFCGAFVSQPPHLSPHSLPA